MNRANDSRVGWVQERDRNKPTFTQAPCTETLPYFRKQSIGPRDMDSDASSFSLKHAGPSGGSSQILKLRGLDSPADSSPSFL